MADPSAMDILAISGIPSDSKKAHMMQEGLCFQCGKQGYISCECLNKKGKGLQPGKISAMEDQIQQLVGGTAALKGGGMVDKAGQGRAEFSKNGGTQE